MKKIMGLMRISFLHSGDIVPKKGLQLGWAPKWGGLQFIKNIDNEVQDVLDLDIGDTSIFNALH